MGTRSYTYLRAVTEGRHHGGALLRLARELRLRLGVPPHVVEALLPDNQTIT